MQQRLLSFVLAVAGLGGTAFAGQAINLDAGDPNATLPGPTFGAGAGQVGTWNAFGNPAGSSPHTLNDPVDVTGTPATGVSVSVDTYAGNFNFDNPGTTGDDQALLDEIFDLGGEGSSTNVTISGLSDGEYQIYTYAWAPDSDTFRTAVTVAGSPDPVQLVGGLWAGSYVQGLTHAVHAVTVGGGSDILINLATNTGFGSLCGIQVVPLGEPPIGENYCGPAVPNSDGLSAVITATGDNTAGGSFTLTATDMTANSFGYFIAGPANGEFAPATSQGIFCLKGGPPNSLGRFLPPFMSDGSGSADILVDSNAIPSGGGSVAMSSGQTYYFQAYYRDGANTNFTDGTGITFQ